MAREERCSRILCVSGVSKGRSGEKRRCCAGLKRKRGSSGFCGGYATHISEEWRDDEDDDGGGNKEDCVGNSVSCLLARNFWASSIHCDVCKLLVVVMTGGVPLKYIRTDESISERNNVRTDEKVHGGFRTYGNKIHLSSAEKRDRRSRRLVTCVRSSEGCSRDARCGDLLGSKTTFESKKSECGTVGTILESEIDEKSRITLDQFLEPKCICEIARASVDSVFLCVLKSSTTNWNVER